MKEKKTTGKTLKAQLFSAVAMMLVATISLGSATYAWFINNRTVEVENMKLTVSTSTSMMVSVGQKVGTDGVISTWTPYKTVITNADITGAAPDGAGWTNMFATTVDYQMVPSSIGNQGLIKTDPKFWKSMNTVDNGLLTTFEGITKNLSAVGEGAVKKLPLRFLSSADLNVYFGAETLDNIANMISQVDTTGDATAQALSKEKADKIKTALRVSIVPHTTTGVGGVGVFDAAKSVPVIFQFDNGTKAFTGSAYNTSYGTILPAAVFPDPTSDTTASTETTLDLALKALQKEGEGKYAAIKAAATAGNLVEKVEIQQAALPTAKGTGYLATVTSADVTAPTTSGN
ncbi:MAG: hypothetical protein RSC08_00530, partial [Oscillospiraceae bacterium]